MTQYPWIRIDPAEEKRQLERARPLLGSDIRLNLDECRRRGWQAAIFGYGPLLQRGLATRMCSVARKLNLGDLITAVQVPLDKEPNRYYERESYRLPYDPAVMEKWAVKMSWAHWLLMPDPMAFVHLCTLENFNVVAAPAELIPKLIGCTAKQAWKRAQRLIELEATVSQSHGEWMAAELAYYGEDIGMQS
jgi:hypothetical protein